MGMDVLGLAPKSKTGEYFRNNVWWWRPLWNYCVDSFPEITSEVNGHTNSGGGLNAENSLKLSKRIKDDLLSGGVKIYKKKRSEYLKSLPNVCCDICNGTGERLNDNNVKIKCNGCNGEKERKPFESHYRFSITNVRDFQKFLKDCGGFEIW